MLAQGCEHSRRTQHAGADLFMLSIAAAEHGLHLKESVVRKDVGHHFESALEIDGLVLDRERLLQGAHSQPELVKAERHALVLRGGNCCRQRVPGTTPSVLS